MTTTSMLGSDHDEDWRRLDEILARHAAGQALKRAGHSGGRWWVEAVLGPGLVRGQGDSFAAALDDFERRLGGRT